MPRSFGIDLSHHNDPNRVPWERVERDCSFVYCRASYGTTRDRKVVDHSRRVRLAGCQLGLYHFYQPRKTPIEQFAAFAATASVVGYGVGDLLPVLDIEDEPGASGMRVTPDWEPGLADLASRLTRAFGGVILYCGRYYWEALGRPLWVTAQHLWVPHYTADPEPRTPGDEPWLIWQYRVDAYDPKGLGGFAKLAGALDHNRAADRIPRISETSRSVIPEPPDEDADDDDDAWLELRARLTAMPEVDVQGILRRERDFRVDE